MSPPSLELFIRWETLCGELMEVTARFPKALRPSLGGRIDQALLRSCRKLKKSPFVVVE